MSRSSSGPIIRFFSAVSFIICSVLLVEIAPKLDHFDGEEETLSSCYLVSTGYAQSIVLTGFQGVPSTQDLGKSIQSLRRQVELNRQEISKLFFFFVLFNVILLALNALVTGYIVYKGLFRTHDEPRGKTSPYESHLTGVVSTQMLDISRRMTETAQDLGRLAKEANDNLRELRESTRRLQKTSASPFRDSITESPQAALSVNVLEHLDHDANVAPRQNRENVRTSPGMIYVTYYGEQNSRPVLEQAASADYFYIEKKGWDWEVHILDNILRKRPSQEYEGLLGRLFDIVKISNPTRYEVVEYAIVEWIESTGRGALKHRGKIRQV